MGEKRMVACNHTGNRYISEGALAFVKWTNPGNGNDRIPIFVRTRSGRWINKWERIDRLSNFRVKTVTEHHPAFHVNTAPWGDNADSVAAELRAASA